MFFEICSVNILAMIKTTFGRSVFRTCSISLLFVLAATGTVWAQAPFLAKGNQEANVFGGLSYGLDHWRGSFGGNYAYALNKYVMAYGEYSYFPGVSRAIAPQFQGGTQISDAGTTTFRFNDFHGGVHIRLPIFPEKRIVPYVSGGMGWLRSDLTGGLPIIQGNSTTYLPFSLNSKDGFAVNGGGGLRLYLSGDGRFGLRVEAKVYKPVDGPTTGTFGKISLGVFYQFK
jgi:hypothetical protein